MFGLGEFRDAAAVYCCEANFLLNHACSVPIGVRTLQNCVIKGEMMRKLILKMSITLDGFVGGSARSGTTPIRKLDRPLYLELIETKRFSAGAVAHVYRAA